MSAFTIPQVTFAYAPPPSSPDQPTLPPFTCNVTFGPTLSQSFDGLGSVTPVDVPPVATTPWALVCTIELVLQPTGGNEAGGMLSGSFFVPPTLTQLALSIAEWNLAADGLLDRVLVKATTERQTFAVVLENRIPQESATPPPPPISSFSPE